MELLSTQQILSEELNRINFDLFVIVSGYEKRAVFLLEQYNISAKLKIALGFKERISKLHRKENEKIIKDHGFKIIPVSGENLTELDPVFQSTCLQTEKNRITKILVDYSSMTKVWYSRIINFFINFSPKNSRSEVYFSYTPAEFSEPRKYKPAKIIHSLFGKSKMRSDPSKPVALIAGLGLDNIRVKILIKSIRPSITYLLYPDPGNQPVYIKKLFKNNQRVIESVEVRNLINYPFNDLRKTDQILTNLCLDLRQKYNVIIAPVGPKVFSLVSLLLATRYPDLDVWRVSRGKDEPAIDRVPASDPLIYKVDFISSDFEE